ncbi:MAG: TadE/TadG family type IV pilus assembly protein [Pirellulales bacterium]
MFVRRATLQREENHAPAAGGTRSARPTGRGLRPGGVVVEFAVVAPVFFLLVFGMIEFSRMAMCYQVMTNAVREGARLGTIPGTSSSDVLNRVNQYLSGGFVNGVSVSVQPGEVATLNAGQTFTVSAEVTYDDVCWLPTPAFLGGRVLRAESVMAREGS